MKQNTLDKSRRNHNGSERIDEPLQHRTVRRSREQMEALEVQPFTGTGSPQHQDLRWRRAKSNAGSAFLWCGCRRSSWHVEMWMFLGCFMMLSVEFWLLELMGCSLDYCIAWMASTLMFESRMKRSCWTSFLTASCRTPNKPCCTG